MWKGKGMNECEARDATDQYIYKVKLKKMFNMSSLCIAYKAKSIENKLS